jgi:CO dehydrogenase maturation factor
MKIIVCGKGGSGKSAVTILVARVLSKNHRVYVVDSDESNTLLSGMLGTDSPRPLVEYLGGKGNIFKRGEVDIVKALTKAGQGIRFTELPSHYLSSSPEGITLATIGKVREFGEGCACPFNFLAKILLKNLVLEHNEIVLVDTDAGVEHVGRGVEEGCDAILTVADPTAESLQLAKILNREAVKLDKTFWLVINKVTPSIVDIVTMKAQDVGLDVVGLIRFDEDVFRSCLMGENLRSKEALVDVQSVLTRMSLIEEST